METNESRFLDDEIRQHVAGAVSVPPEVEHRLRSQLSEFQARLNAEETRHTLAIFRWPRPSWHQLGVVGAAAVLLLAAMATLLRPRTSFADVASSVLKQPWVYSRIVDGQQRETECWFSPSKDISAWRRQDSIDYEDHRLQVYYSYKPTEATVYRGPIVWHSQASRFETMAAAMKVLVQTGRPPDASTSRADFLASTNKSIKILGQSVEKVTEEGKNWTNFRLTVQYPESNEKVHMLFRVDSTSQLPDLCRVEGHRDGKPRTVETRFEYPGRGPTDIYDLGVPKEAKFVDRMPVGDLKRILETLRAGRERMDNYRAVFVRRSEMPDERWWLDSPMIFYRKGNQFRAEYPGESKGDFTKIQRPADGEDLGKWWLSRTKDYWYFPQYVLQGSVLLTSTVKPVTDADGSKHLDLVSVHESHINMVPGETYPAEYSMRPEFACRPPLGIGDPHQEPSLDLHPAEGPAGCILLSVGHTSKEGRVNDKGVGIVDGQRFWLDPHRDYIVMRWDLMMHNADGKDVVTDNHTVEEVARSPEGVWYATKVRRKNAVRLSDGRRFDEIYEMYVDFPVNLPDALFESPAPSRIH